MRDRWREVTLSEITAFAGGNAFPPSLQGSDHGDFPFAKVSDMNATGNERVMSFAANWITEAQRNQLRARWWPTGTVIFPKVGAALLTEKRRILGRSAVIDNNIMGLVPGCDILPEYLLHFMEMTPLAPFAQHGTVPSVNQSHLSRISLMLPPLSEQRRIVDLIGSVDDAITAADGETMSSQLSVVALVAAGIERATGTVARQLGDVMTIVRGGSPRPIAKFETQDPDGYPWIKIGDIEPDGMYVERTATRIRPEGLSKTRLIHPGDFILSNSMSFGRPYISRISGCIHDGWLALSNYSGDLDREFLYHLLRSNSVQTQFAHFAAGSGVKNLKKESVARVTVDLPPLSVQREIVARAGSARDAADAARATTEALRTLRSNLLTVLLSGEHAIPETYDQLLNLDAEAAA